MRYTEPRNLLILLGLICQGFSWEVDYVPVVYAVLWWICLRQRREKPLVSRDIEALLLLAACGTFKYLSATWEIGHNVMIFVGGNSLFVYQLVHLLERPVPRTRDLSVLVALIHIGVGTQVVFDYKAFVILCAFLVVGPKALTALENERYGQSAQSTSPFAVRLRFREICGLALLTVTFFVSFPRFNFQARPPSQLLGGGGRGPLDQQMDMSDSAGDGGDALIFRIQGEGISYLKLYGLDQFDGRAWTASHWARKIKNQMGPENPEAALQRTVTITNYTLLDNKLPVDGYVTTVQGSFVSRPYIAGDGGVKIDFKLRNNTSYVYWTQPVDPTDSLDDRQLRRYLELPEQSEQLQAWLQDFLGNDNDTASQVGRLATYFQSEFQYDLGAPDLDRLNPIDDFMFVERRGHCERFASALTVLLRMRGIPARVVGGYIPVEKNELGEFFNIRSKNAHAWTEYFLPGQGWTIADATPYGRGVEDTPRALALTLFEWVEYTWYSRIVEFDAHEQRALFSFLGSHLRDAVSVILNYLLVILAGCGLIGIGMLAWQVDWRRLLSRFFSREKTKQRRKREVHHFYDRMMRLLARQRCYRQPSQTPWEFLGQLESTQHPRIDDIRMITTIFCDMRYGNRDIESTKMIDLQHALARIRHR